MAGGVRAGGLPEDLTVARSGKGCGLRLARGEDVGAMNLTFDTGVNTNHVSLMAMLTWHWQKQMENIMSAGIGFLFIRSM
jgi:hypothetical protein